MEGSPTPGPRLVVILPGNPGDEAFYSPFAEDLAGRGHRVLITAHPCLPAPAPDLLPYARYHAEQARRHLAGLGPTAGTVEVVLVGHSVGAYLAYLIVAHGLLPVARVFMLFPFLTRPALSGRLLLRVVARRWLVSAALRAWRWLPAGLQRWLIVRAGAGDRVAAVRAALEPGRLSGYLNMADTERAEIATRADARYLSEEPLFRDAARFAVLLCAGDRWAPAALARQLAPFAHQLGGGVTHTFVVHPAQRRIVAERLHRLLVGAGPPAPA
jgi:pimeloyl-ACP methyl ester carboxylesterase